MLTLKTPSLVNIGTDSWLWKKNAKKRVQCWVQNTK